MTFHETGINVQTCKAYSSVNLHITNLACICTKSNEKFAIHNH